MIDINELRRLAQAATPGPWVSQGRYIGTPSHMSYIGEVRDQCGNWSDTEKSRADSAFIAAANPAAITELLDRLEAAEKERDDVAQQLVQSERGKRAISDECDALRAKITEMERQEPVGKFVQHPSNGLWEQDGYGDNPDARPLYALPGAQGE